MTGLEESIFLRDIADLSAVPVIHDDDLPWLDVSGGATGLPTSDEPVSRRAAYRICFMGRESDYYGLYGHMGMSRTGVLLEKVETIREIPIPDGLKFANRPD
jgi:hypothetical protein